MSPKTSPKYLKLKAVIELFFAYCTRIQCRNISIVCFEYLSIFILFRLLLVEYHMKYPFDTVRQVYLRRFLAELNDIAINTPQDDYEAFIKLFKKSKDYIKTNALLKTIEILDNTNLTKKDVQTLLTTLNLRTSHQDKETKIVIANLNAVLQCELPKLFKSFHTDARKKYLRNTFRKVKASLSFSLTLHLSFTAYFPL